MIISYISNFLRLKNNTNKINQYPKSKDKNAKLFPTSTREWNNSTYTFNKSNSYLLPVSNNLALQIIKVYFSLFNSFIESKLRTKRLLYRFKRLSSNKIYLSEGKFKHTNRKVDITLYVFNRQKNNYLLAIDKWYLKNFYKPAFNRKLVNKLRSIDFKGTQKLENFNRNKFLLVSSFNNVIETKGFNNIYSYINNFYNKIVNKSLKKLQLYVYYKQLIFLNRSKYNSSFLQLLTKYIERIFNKNIEFNFVSVNKFYLNSDIISNSIRLKIIRNRRKLLKYINILKSKINIRKKNLLVNRAAFNRVRPNLSNKSLLKNYVFDKLKYKHLSGFRVEIKGRLTRRNTASRSLSKYIYKGNLLNIDSSYRGLSSVLLKGNLKSNMQLTKLNSKSRIGSFGLKTWVSSN